MKSLIIIVLLLGSVGLAHGEEVTNKQDRQCEKRHVAMANTIGVFVHNNTTGIGDQLIRGLAKALVEAETMEELSNVLKTMEMISIRQGRGRHS